MNVLLCVTGSVAATLTPKFIEELAINNHYINVVVTDSALKFKKPSDYWGAYYTDEQEWSYYNTTQKVLHIDLVKWADVLLVAPCTANTLAKIYIGMADNLLTSCVRAWDHKKKFIIAPAMNTQMYNNPPTSRHMNEMKNSGVIFVPPQKKTLYCGDTGIGAMANISDIISQI